MKNMIRRRVMFASAAVVLRLACLAAESEVPSGPENLFPNASFEEGGQKAQWPLVPGGTWGAEKLKNELGKPLFAFFGPSDSCAHTGNRSFHIKDEHGGGYNNNIGCALPKSVAKALAGKGLKLSAWVKLVDKNVQGDVGIGVRVECRESPVVFAAADFPRDKRNTDGFVKLSCYLKVPRDAEQVTVLFRCANGWYGRGEAFYDDIELSVIPIESVPETAAEREKRLRKPFVPNRAAMAWAEKWTAPRTFTDDGRRRPSVRGGNLVLPDGSFFYPVGPWIHPSSDRDWNEKAIKRHGIDHPAYTLPPGKCAFESVGCNSVHVSGAPEELGAAASGYAQDEKKVAEKARHYRETWAGFEDYYTTVDFAFGYRDLMKSRNPDLVDRIEQRRSGWHSFIPFCPESKEGKEYYRTYIGTGAKLMLDAGLNVGIWELFNESAYGCECEFNKRDFAARSQRKYGTVAVANAAWGTSFKDFDELAKARDFGRFNGLWNEWCAFLATRYAEVLDEYRQYIRSFDKRENVYFTEQLWLYQLWDGMTDYRKIAQTIDLLTIEGGWGYGGGVDGLKARDEMEVVVFGGSLHWYALDFFQAIVRGRKPVINSELYCSRIVDGKRVPSRAIDLVTSLWTEFFHGLSGSHMYIWEKRAPEWTTLEQAKANVLSPSYKSNALLNPYNWPVGELDAFKRFQSELGKYQSLISEFPRTTPASVAIYHSQASSAMALKFGRPIKMPMVRAYSATLHAFYPTTFVFDGDLTDGKMPEGIQAIVVPAADFETAAVRTALECFIARGGLVVADKGAFLYDERGQAGGGPPQGAVLYDAGQNSAGPVVDVLARAGVRKTAELVPTDGKGDIPGADVQVIDRGDFKLALVVNLVAGVDARRVRLSLPIAEEGEWEVFDGVAGKRFCTRAGNRHWTSADIRHGIDMDLPYQERVLIALRRIPADMTFKDGERILFLGDSITPTDGYPQFVCNYYLTRFPKRDIAFECAGVSGDGTRWCDWRLEEDVISRKPTVVSVMFGMNDVAHHSGVWEKGQPKETQDAFRTNVVSKFATHFDHLAQRLCGELPEVGLLLMTPTPYDAVSTRLQSTSNNHAGVNAALADVSGYVRRNGGRFGGRVIDIHAPMKAFLEHAREQFALVGSDRVHPNEAGHLFVAWKFLEQQNAPGVISDVEIDYSSARMTRAQNADVSNVRILPDGRLSFAVLEGALPMPIPPKLEKFAHDAGLCESLNREIVSIKNLPEGQWVLFVDGEKAMTASAEAFATGVNLACADTPQHRQAEAVRAANARRFGDLDYVLWRCRLARWALNRRTEVNPDDLAAVQAYRDGLPEAQRRKWPWVALDPYLENWARRKEIMSEIERRHGEIRKMSRPVQHAYELRRTN